MKELRLRKLKFTICRWWSQYLDPSLLYRIQSLHTYPQGCMRTLLWVRTKLHPFRSHMKDDKTPLGWLRWRVAPHFLGHGTASLLSRCLHKAALLIKVIKTETTLSSLDHACMCAKSFHSCLMLHNPVDCSLPGSSVHGILQVRILEWVAMSSSRGSSQPKDGAVSLCLLNWQVGSLLLVLPGKPLLDYKSLLFPRKHICEMYLQSTSRYLWGHHCAPIHHLSPVDRCRSLPTSLDEPIHSSLLSVHYPLGCCYISRIMSPSV